MAWLLVTTLMAMTVRTAITYNMAANSANSYQQFYQMQSYPLPNQRVQHYGGYGGPLIAIYPSEQEPIFVHDTVRPVKRPTRSRSKTRSTTPLFPVTTRPIREWLSSLTARRVTVTETQTVTTVVTATKVTATRCVGAKVVLESAKVVLESTKPVQKQQV